MRLNVALVFVTISYFQLSLASASNDSLLKKSTSITPHYSLHDVQMGERIFYGLNSSLTNSINCASCHNIDRIDTFSWYPSALDIALKCEKLDTASFKALLMQPSGKLMTLTHDSLQFTDEQIYQLKAFLTDLAVHGTKEIKPLKTNRIIFILLIFLFSLSLIDLTITKKVRIKILHIIILVVSAFFISDYIIQASIDLGRSQNYQPDQPIKFSHKVHAGQNKTNCLYCHYNAQQSKFAGIPPVSLCMNCHIIVGEGTRSGKFEIGKIYEALQNNKPVQWVKVDNLPDHVFFSHVQHVVAGKVECAKCHGDVTGMDQIVQVSDFSMGFCVHCHRETGVQFSNTFYGKYEKLQKDFKDGKIKMVTVAKIGGTDCMKCHY
jgi:Cytochrome c7 and related cytochrome c